MTPTQPYKTFQHSVQSLKELLTFHKLISTDYPLLESQADELLRAVIVLSVSALDNFLHDFYRNSIVENYLGKGNFNVQFHKINVSIKALRDVDSAFSENERRVALDSELRKLQKTESFQSPKSIENIFNNLNLKNIWSRLSASMNIPAQQIKEELGLIIERRNKISHESDWDYFNQQKNVVESQDVKNVVDFIEKMVLSIVNLTPEA